MKVYKRINSNPFNNITRIKISSSFDVYIKKKVPQDNYVINGVDLSPVFGRDSILAIKKYLSIVKRTDYKKYINKDNLFFHKFQTEITFGYGKKEQSLQQILENELIKEGAILKLYKLSIDTLLLHEESSKYLKYSEIPINRSILNCKLETEVLKPLSNTLNPIQVNSISPILEDCKYLNHGDLQPKNILINKNANKYPRLIDFEECFWGPYAWDVGFLWGNILTIAANTNSVEILKKSFYQLIKEVDYKSKRNIILFTLSTLLMRRYDFPLFEKNENYTKKIDPFIKTLKTDYINLNTFTK